VTDALARLETMVLEDESGQARAAAAVSLGKLGDAEAVGPLIEALKDTDAVVAQEARDSLARIGRPAMEPCIEALRSDDPDTRFAAARAVEALARENVRDDRAVRPLIELLRETEEAMVARRGTSEVKVTDWSNRMKWVGSALVAVTGVNRDPTFRTGDAHWGRWWDANKERYP
jgi:HEAT repeat protein